MLLSGLGPLLPRVAASLRRTVPAAVTAAAVVCRPAGPLAAQRWYADRAAGSHQLKEAAQKPRRQRSPKPSGDLKNLVKPDRQNPSPRLGNTATVDFLKRLDREFSGFSMPQPAEPPGPKVLVLAGPTGIGKSQMALDLVKFGHIPNGEIVSADVFQAYSGLHIGTSTPPPEFFEQVPHHMFGFVDPNETMNSSDYYQRTLQTIEDIVARGGTPIIVGGAGFYLQNILLGGLSGVPRSDPETRAKVAQMLEADSNWSKSFARLVDLDPTRASSISVNDYRRLSRALEIAMTPGNLPSQGSFSRKPKYDFRPIFVTEPNRLAFMDRINRRSEWMVTSGFVEEVIDLLAAGYTEKSPAMRAFGYRDCIEMLRFGAATGRLALKQLCTDLTQDTRSYASGQMRWFRHDASFYWLTASNPSVLSDIVRLFSAAYVAPHENDLSPVPIQRIARTLPFLLSSAEKTRFDVDAYYALSRRSTPYQYGISPSEEFMLEERILKYLAERNVSLPLNVDDTE